MKVQEITSTSPSKDICSDTKSQDNTKENTVLCRLSSNLFTMTTELLYEELLKEYESVHDLYTHLSFIMTSLTSEEIWNIVTKCYYEYYFIHHPELEEFINTYYNTQITWYCFCSILQKCTSSSLVHDIVHSSSSTSSILSLTKIKTKKRHEKYDEKYIPLLKALDRYQEELKFTIQPFLKENEKCHEMLCVVLRYIHRLSSREYNTRKLSKENEELIDMIMSKEKEFRELIFIAYMWIFRNQILEKYKLQSLLEFEDTYIPMEVEMPTKEQVNIEVEYIKREILSNLSPCSSPSTSPRSSPSQPEFIEIKGIKNIPVSFESPFKSSLKTFLYKYHTDTQVNYSIVQYVSTVEECWMIPSLKRAYELSLLDCETDSKSKVEMIIILSSTEMKKVESQEQKVLMNILKENDIKLWTRKKTKPQMKKRMELN